MQLPKATIYRALDLSNLLPFESGKPERIPGTSTEIMESHSPDDAHSVSAVAVIDLSDGAGAHGGGAHGDVHGALTSSVVVIGGEEAMGGHDGLLQGEHTGDEEEDEEDEYEEEGDDDDDACGPDCTHDHGTPMHMIHIGGVQPHRHHGHGHSHQTQTQTCFPRGATGMMTLEAPSSPSLSASSTTTTATGKRKRVVLSIHEKQQVLQRLEMGEPPVVIAKDFGISRQQVSDIKKNKERILAFCIDAKHLSSLRRKTLKATTEYHPGVEQELYRWLIRQRRLGRAVTHETLTHKTTDLFMQYAADDAANVSYRSINVWLRHFKRAHNIKNMTEDELAKLPATFTPEMDMNGATNANNRDMNGSNSGGSQPDAVGIPGTERLPSSNAQVSHEATDDVSSYMSSMVLPTQPTQHQQFILQNHAPQSDVNAAQPFEMLMLSSASTLASSSTPVAPTQPLLGSATLPPTTATALHSCAHLVQTLTLQLSLFEREIAAKLDTLDTRVEKLTLLAYQSRGRVV